MFLIKSFTFNPISENTYILYNDEGQCIIIDPGCYSTEEQDELYAFIAQKHLLPALLINTHCHLDHVFGVKDVAEKYDLTLCIHRLDKPVLDMAPTAGLMYGLPFDNYSGPINWIEEGEDIFLGKDSLRAVWVPGHSPGSLCFYCEDQRFLIGGDVLFYRSIGRSDLPGGDGAALVKNIREKLFRLPDDVVVHPGHGPVTTIGEEKMFNPFVQ